jgi:uncharacterized protein YdiU (UPF0061 family)
MHQVVERLADLAAAYMVAGFVHGVLNSDNMNITGESFDYGPWRWLPQWEPGFTAAYFDENGLYAFGRQAEAIHWNCSQLAMSLRPLVDAPPLVAALDRYPELYSSAVLRRFCWRLGLKESSEEDGQFLAAAAVEQMREDGQGPDAFFFTHRGGRNATGKLAEAIAPYEILPGALDHPYWAESLPQSMLIDEVEAIWARIDADDDWSALESKIIALRTMGEALGEPPVPSGH